MTKTATGSVARYHLIAQMTGPQIVQLYQYLHACHDRYRDIYTTCTEYWDLGIALCRERLTELGYRFKTLRPGHPDMIETPTGRLINYLPA